MQIQDILTLAQENKASDIHISPGNPVMLRIDGDLEPFGEQKLMPNDIDEMLRPLMSNKELNHLEEVGEFCHRADGEEERPGAGNRCHWKR